MARNLRLRKSFTAHCTANEDAIRRMTDPPAPGMGVDGCVIGCSTRRGFDSRFGIELPRKADEVEAAYRQPIRAKNLSDCPQPTGVPTGFSSLFAQVRSSPQRFDSVLFCPADARLGVNRVERGLRAIAVILWERGLRAIGYRPRSGLLQHPRGSGSPGRSPCAIVRRQGEWPHSGQGKWPGPTDSRTDRPSVGNSQSF
jgi:hypothetical protein